MLNQLPPIELISFPESQYFKEETVKHQLVAHHTASGRGVDGDFRHWLEDPARVATCIIIDAAGKSYQCYSSKYWGHHLGTHAANNVALNKASIAVEIDNWGGLVYDEKEKVFRSYTGTVVPKERVIEYEKSYRGFRFFERYTDDQLETFKKLALFWGELYNIPLDYKEDIWDVCPRALAGDPGLFTHTSYRKDKSDCHPQPELIEMFKSLTK